jgi:hypothetical protein
MPPLTFNSANYRNSNPTGLGADNVGQIVKTTYSGVANDNAETVANQEGFQAPQVKQRNVPYTSGP